MSSVVGDDLSVVLFFLKHILIRYLNIFIITAYEIG